MRRWVNGIIDTSAVDEENHKNSIGGAGLLTYIWIVYIRGKIDR